MFDDKESAVWENFDLCKLEEITIRYDDKKPTATFKWVKGPRLPVIPTAPPKPAARRRPRSAGTGHASPRLISA